jgi:ankyrin repeat protein
VLTHPLPRAATQDEATPLHRAVAAGHLAPTNVLLRFGADANARGEGGNTPLHVAADAGRTALVKALLDAGADALAQDAVRKPAQSAAQRFLMLRHAWL